MIKGPRGESDDTAAVVETGKTRVKCTYFVRITIYLLGTRVDFSHAYYDAIIHARVKHSSLYLCSNSRNNR